MRSLNARLERLERRLPEPRQARWQKGWERYWRSIATIYGKPGEAEGPVPPCPDADEFLDHVARIYGEAETMRP